MSVRWLVAAFLALLSLVSLVGSGASGSRQQGADTSEHLAPAGQLPAALDALYPPAAPGPVLLATMHELNAALTGVVVDLMESDPEGAAAHFERFRLRYAAAARQVPEWESFYGSEPVEALGRSLAGGDPGAVMAAVGEVGAVCHRCHVAYMVPVQQRFHWPQFATLTLHDPVADTDVGFAAFMQMLNANLVGVGVDVEQGQRENARDHVGALRARMAELRNACDACHESERAYYVDERVEGVIAELQAALDAPQIDPGAVAGASMRIGEESCARCHRIHLPAAYSGLASR